MSSIDVDVVWNQFTEALKWEPLGWEEPFLDVVDKIIEQNLLVLEQRFGPDGTTPLNYVCHPVRFDVIDVIERLVERFPKALTMADNDGYLPLHNICMSEEAPLHLVQLFVSKFPDSLKAKTSMCREDKTPFYLAVENSACWSLDVIRFLYDQYPEAALQKSYWGRTPLHNACYSNRYVIELLVELCPEALTVTDDDGSLPLHLICSSKLEDQDMLLEITNCSLSLDVIEYLYAACPKAARMQNYRGFTPFHYSCFKKNETAVKFLLERDPALILAVNEQDKHRFDEMKKAIRENSHIYECVQNAALALVGKLVIKNKKSLSEIEPTVIAEHLAKILETRPFPTLQQLHSPNTSDEIIRVCTKQKVYDQLETMLYTQTFPTLLKGYRSMIRIDQSGFLQDDPGNKAKYIAVLAATSCVNDNNSDDDNSDDDNNHNNKDDNNYGNVPLLFQQLRANTLLCKRLSQRIMNNNNYQDEANANEKQRTS